MSRIGNTFKNVHLYLMSFLGLDVLASQKRKETEEKEPEKKKSKSDKDDRSNRNKDRLVWNI